MARDIKRSYNEKERECRLGCDLTSPEPLCPGGLFSWHPGETDRGNAYRWGLTRSDFGDWRVGEVCFVGCCGGGLTQRTPCPYLYPMSTWPRRGG